MKEPTTDDPMYFAGSSLSLADIVVFEMLEDLIRPLMPDVFQKFPALVAFHKRMAAVPSIAAYLTSSKRPSTTLPPHAPFLNTPEACK